MKVINVYERYFEAEGTFHGAPRRGVNVQLVATSDAGEVFYEVVVSFFPHEEPDDFRISYDACFSKEIYRAHGRRSKKREVDFLEELQKNADDLAKENGGRIFWDKPLIDERRG